MVLISYQRIPFTVGPIHLQLSVGRFAQLGTVDYVVQTALNNRDAFDAVAQQFSLIGKAADYGVTGCPPNTDPIVTAGDQYGSASSTPWNQVKLDTATNSCPATLSPAPASVPIGCFYHVDVSCSHLLQDGAGDVSSVRTCTGKAGPVILVGFHLITGDVPDWTWQTFWWDWSPATYPGNGDRPGLSAPWWMYSMAVTRPSSDTPYDDRTNRSDAAPISRCLPSNFR